MSLRDATGAENHDLAASAVEAVIAPTAKDLGGFTVQRLLPALGRRQVGPFVFLDVMGGPEVGFAAGAGLDVRPHPHIGLATVTYLFAGEIVHRDSLGSCQPIRPGDLNWMIAGRGIAHSERTSDEVRRRGGPLHGIQLWVALPDDAEEVEPSFDHHPAATVPTARVAGATVRVLAGEAFGLHSPARTLSPMAYVDLALDDGAGLEIPADHPERALLVVDGAVEVGDRRCASSELVVLAAGRPAPVRAAAGAARVLLLAGSPLGPRHVWWNFVSSSRDRIEEAKQAWRERRFPPVPGDEVERIPLPE
jgi:redox-sensitive bicupin YhaK (pirin superfamily)